MPEPRAAVRVHTASASSRGSPILPAGEEGIPYERELPMKERLPPDWSRMGRAVGLLIVIAFASAILWSIWSETLLPLMRKGDLRGLSLNMTGIPLILLGVGLLVYGGIQFVNRTAVALGDETFRERASFVRSDPRPEAHHRRHADQHVTPMLAPVLRPILWCACDLSPLVSSTPAAQVLPLPTKRIL